MMLPDSVAHGIAQKRKDSNVRKKMPPQTTRVLDLPEAKRA
jgi:hypothetical protein